MRNPIKLWKKRRQERRSRKELEKIARVFGSLDKLEDKGLLLWKPKERQLFIVSQLATVMMTNALKWQGFMDNLFAWLYHRQAQDAWEAYFLKEEMKAVREAKKNYANITKAEVMAIRQARREEIMMSDIPQPEVKPFQFFITHPTKDEDGSWQMEMVGVGIYDEGNFEMMPWEEVSVKG